MQRQITINPQKMIAFIYCLVTALVLLSGCEAADQKFMATGSVTNIILNPMSGEGSWSSLDEEVGDKPPVLAGFPGSQPPPSNGGNAGDTSGGTEGSTGGSDGSTGGTVAPPAQNSSDTNVSRTEADACSELLGVEPSKVRVIRAGQDLTITGNQPIAIKVTGNQTKISMNILGTAGQTLPGLCVYALGNQPDITINLGVALGGLYYKARGNQSRAVVQVSLLASLMKSFTADMSGNLASLVIWGKGKYICPTVSMSGHNPVVNCTQN